MAKETVKKYKKYKLLDYFGVIFLSLFLFFVWHLYKGPIAVPFLKPYIIQALNGSEDYQVSLDSVNIELVRSIQPIKIIANNIVYKKADDSFVINAPRTSVSFSLRALLRGIIAPSAIEVDSPNIYAFTSYGIEAGKTNEANKKKIEYYSNMLEDFLERYNSGDKYFVENYINEISIKNASFEFHEVDLGRKWTLNDVNYHFEREGEQIYTEANALFTINNNTSSVGIEVAFDNNKKDLNLKSYFSDVIPSDIVNSFVEEKQRKELYQINLPLSGSLETNIALKGIINERKKILDDLDNAVKKIKLQLEGGQGNIMFTSDEAFKYDISSFTLDGTIEGGLKQLKVSGAEFDLGGQKMTLGFEVSGLKNYILEDSLKDIKAVITANIKNLKFDDLPKYWPRYIGESAWKWCEDSLFVGTAKDGEFRFDFGYDKKKKAVVFQELKGKVYAEDLTVRYINTMPVITNVYGEALFDSNSITVNIDKGKSDGVILTGGYVRLYDLDKYNNYADIELKTESSVTDALRLIDNPPLNFVKDMKIPADRLSGDASTTVKLDLELKEDIEADEVKADVKSTLTNVTMKDVIDGKNLTSQALELSVNNNELLLSGAAEIDGIPLTFEWNENFKQKAEKTKYDISFKLDDKVKKKLGLDKIEYINPPYIEGYADVAAQISISDDKKTKIDMNADIKNAAIDYSFLGFRKLSGSDGNIMAEIEINGNKLSGIPSFSLSKPDFNLSGKIELDKSGSVKIIDIDTIKGPKTNARAKIEWAEENKKPLIKVNVSGNSYDLAEFFERREADSKKKAVQDEKKQAEQEELELENITDTDINIAVNRLWTNKFVSISSFAGTAKVRKNIGLHELHMIGNYGNSKEVKLKADYVPKPNNEYYLSITSNNAGSTFKVLRIYDDISGGNLKIEAKKGADKKFIGHASIRDFNLHNTPVLAKVLSMASLTGIVGMLSGEGIAFSHLDAPFEYKNKILSVTDARAFGNVLGITMTGEYNWGKEEVSGKGVIAPAYSINSFLGSIPLVGNLLAGKDGTVFAANYSIKGKIDDVKVSINPLSALSPGSLKDLFSSLFGSQDNVKN